MPLTADQKLELSKRLDPSHVKSREQSGRKLSYIEGWVAIAEANRIFGHDGWDRETIEMREVRPPELVKSSAGKETWRVGFICKVRVTVAGTFREGTGYGSGALPDLGEAYESAVKEAETDAMKRALMTFGNPFGLALYDKAQAGVGVDKPKTDKTPAWWEGRIMGAANPDKLKAIYDEMGQEPEEDLSATEFERLNALVTKRLADLRK